MIWGPDGRLSFSVPASVVSVRVPVWEFTWIDAFSGQPVAVVLDGVWLVGAFLPVDHQVIEIDNSAAAVITAVIFGIVWKVFVGHVDLVPVGPVGTKFIEGGAPAVGFKEQEKWPLAAGEFQEPGLAKPAIRVQ